jgi:hypothetical protein
MTILDEILERELRKILPLPKTVPSNIVDVPATSLEPQIKGCTLMYQVGTSDKVYHVQVVQVIGGYDVRFQYGRRGKTLNEGCKNSFALNMNEAFRLYDILVESKVAKGYEFYS